MREITVTIFENFNNAVEQIPLEEMLSRIQSGIYAHQIKPIRRLLSEGNLKAYDRAKRLLRAFTPSAQFVRGRKMQYMVKYYSVIVLDIDKLSGEELIRVKRMIILCQYTLACFVSPSGNGLKVLVCVSTGVEEHRNAFLSVQQFYTALTGVAIDPSGKDVTRLCFVSYDPELYYNPEALIFTPLQGVGQSWPVAGPDKPVLKEGQLLPDGGGQEGRPQGLPLQTEQIGTTKDQVGEISTWATRQTVSTQGSSGITDTYSRCITYVERHCSFVEGHRNDFVFALALQLRRAGQPEGETLMLMLQDYCFDEKEVRSCVRSAYSYIWQDDPVVTKPPELVRSPLHDEEFSAGMTEPVDIPANPAKKEKKTVRKQFNLQKTEELLSLWYETRYNEVTGIVEWCHAKTKVLFRRLEDHHENSMLRRLHHADQPIPIALLHSLINSDYSPSFNPFTDYFKNLPPWDGVTDYIDQISRTVNTDDDDYWTFCFRKWFVAYAASLVEDQIINHTVIVFIGIQGVGKTSWMKLLVPRTLRNYLGTAALQTDSKDTAIQLSECALIILDEMENLNRKDLASFKELITRPEIRIRRPYGRNSENMPHRASFIASVNFKQILTDPSGSRRYLCSKVNSLDYKHEVDIDRAMAQAQALYKSGFKFWFDQEEIRELTDRNEDYMSKSVEEELIETWLQPVTREEWKSRNLFANGRNIQLMTSTQIAIKLMEKAKLVLGDGTLVKIGKVMHKLNFERVRKGNNHLYLLRIIEAEAVERDCRTLEDIREQEAEQEANNQIILHEDDLFNTSEDNRLPF